jgi:hypothetical protein
MKSKEKEKKTTADQKCMKNNVVVRISNKMVWLVLLLSDILFILDKISKARNSTMFAIRFAYKSYDRRIKTKLNGAQHAAKKLIVLFDVILYETKETPSM